MRNAFISAFARSLEGSITLRDVKKNLDELDPNKDEEPDKKGSKEDKVAQKPKPKPGPAGKS